MWDEFVAIVAYLANFCASSSLKGKTPHELWFGRVPSLSHLREIGCRTFALKQTNNPKIFQHSTPCTLIGYTPHSKAYHLWDNTTGIIFNSFHVTFIEHLHAQPSDLMPGKTVLLNPDAPPSWEVPLPEQNFLPPKPRSSSPAQDRRPIPCSSPIIPVTYSDPISTSAPTVPPQLASVPSQPADAPLPQPVALPPVQPPICHSEHLAARSHPLATALLTRYSKVSHLHDLLPLSISDQPLPVKEVLAALANGSLKPIPDVGDDPLWVDALASPDKEYWIAGTRDEIQSLSDLQVFVLVPRSSVPNGRRPMHGKLVCKRKRDDSGKISRYKVRYIAKGYAQQYGVDFEKTTTPTAHLESFCLILHLAASLGWDLQQLDVKTAFLHGVLPSEETAYMEQPPGFEEPGKEDWVWRLQKSIYGMKQASQIWNQTFHKMVSNWGFQRM